MTTPSTSGGPADPAASGGPADIVNHVGLCVADLARSRDFYVSVFGFAERNELAVDDGPASKLLEVPEPVGLTAVYLTLGDFVLELLHFDRDGNEAARRRTFTEPGLTHLSFTVADIGATSDAVRRHGGSVVDGTELPGVAVMIRDPDGQLLELLQRR